MRKKLFFFSWVILELIIVIYFVRKIAFQQNILGEAISVNPISKDNVIFPSSDDGPDLKYFYEPKPNKTISKKEDWLPESYAITINKDSLNERFDYSEEEKRSDVLRIVTLGDSFTYGAFVNTKDNYPEQLEDLLNNKLTCKNITKFEVINLGVGGYDIEYPIERFRRRGVKYNPDVVLWFLHDHNFKRINEITKPKEDLYKQQMKKTGELEQYKQKGNFYPFYIKAQQELEEEWTSEQILKYQKDLLSTFNSYYKGKLILFSFPFLETENKAILEDLVKLRKDTYFYDSTPNIYTLREVLPDGHPNTYAYYLIAQTLFSYLTENNLISCQ